MYLRLPTLIIVISLTTSGCALGRLYGSEDPYKKLDENGCFLIEEYNYKEERCYLNCDNLNDEQCAYLRSHVYGDTTPD